ncbi:MAG: dihydroorotate dehydrogenase [Candidatus Bathyarchaeota archaeon B23]|nr:MAG: dihydroorotate dehydrogenase [Candidatus Bathyarchaeota archaeon B23]
MAEIRLAIELAGLRLRNPTMNAAGVLGLTAGLLRRVYEEGAGAVVTKSLGLKPRMGHPNPTVVYVEAGLINAMGLPNPGVEYFLGELGRLKAEGIPVIASFFGETLEEFVEVASRLSEGGVDALELNCSCPNVEGVGLLGSDPGAVERVTEAVKGCVDVPLFVKLSPNVSDIAQVARAAEQGGADGLTAVNTLRAVAIDVETRRPILSNVTGGLSGPALKPVALRCVWEAAEEVEIPIIGCGGISNWRDAVEYLLCGASAIQVGTAVMSRGLGVFREIDEGLRRYLEANGFKEVSEIVGLAHKA